MLTIELCKWLMVRICGEATQLDNDDYVVRLNVGKGLLRKSLIP